MSIGAFEAVVGREFVHEPAQAHVDGTPVVFEVAPGTEEEVAACLRVASERRAPLIARGGGSKIALGNRPRANEVVLLSLLRLDGELEIDAEEGVGTASAGVRIARLRAEAASLGRRTRLDTPHTDATVGGTIAADPVAPTLHAERRLRDDVLGLRIALADGSISRAGGRVVKNVTGYDLVRLHCGACGTLGIVTETTFRLRPVPGTRRVVTRSLPTLDEGFEAAGRLLASGAEPDGSALRPDGNGALLVWMLEGSERDVSARESRFAGYSGDWQSWREVEDRVVDPAAEGAARLRLLGRPSDVASLWARLAETGADGLLALPRAGLVFGEVPEDRVCESVERLRGSGAAVVVEAAAPAAKEGLDVFGPMPDTLPLARSLKARFDPAGILAPGRFAGGI